MAKKKSVERKPIPGDELERAAECLKVMAHPARLRIADMLQDGPLPVHEIADRCGISPSQTCEHLRLLHGRGLLDSKRAGRQVFYSIASPRLPRIIECIRRTCID